MNGITQRFNTLQTVFGPQSWPHLDFWKNLFSWDYWTSSVLSDVPTYLLFGLAIIFILLIGLVIWRTRLVIRNKTMPIYGTLIAQFPALIIIIFVLPLWYLFARSQELPYFSSRLFVLGTLLVILGWLGFMITYSWRVIPQKERLYLEKQRFLRYIPKKKERI